MLCHRYTHLFAGPPSIRASVARSDLAARRRTYTTFLATRAYAYQRKQAQPQSHYRSKRRHQSTSSTAAAAAEQAPITAHTSPFPPPPRRRLLLNSSLFLFSLAAGFAMAAAPASDVINGFISPPTDAETLTLYQPPTARAREINHHIVNHPFAAKLRAEQHMIESRPHLKIPERMRPHNLTGGALLGADRIEVPPLTFSEADGVALPELVQFAYLGPALCGHPGIVHGGLLATMLDEGLARCCFSALPNKVGVTASLKIDYRVPCPAGSYVVLKARTTKVEGRKAWVEGWIELLGEDAGEGTKLVEAEALFIEPKGAKNMARVYSSQ